MIDQNTFLSLVKQKPNPRSSRTALIVQKPQIQSHSELLGISIFCKMDMNCILPDDLLEGILSRLPVRDLLRFRCVSKSWCALIDDSRFIDKHHHAQCALRKAEGDVPFLLYGPIINTIQAADAVQCNLLFKHQGDDVVLNLTSDVVRDRNSAFTHCPDIKWDNTTCIGCANGIVCLSIRFADQDWERYSYIGLWNPATRDFKIFSHLDSPDQLKPPASCIIGFVFDPLSNDFKILATTATVSEQVLAYEVYSLSSDSWKRLSEPSLLGCIGTVIVPTMDSCLNGVKYWTCSILRSHKLPMEARRMFWIVSYNISSEVFKISYPPEVVPPPKDYDGRAFRWEIGLYKEHLALFFTRRPSNAAEYSVDIWVVTEYDDDFGVPLAWQCLFSTGSLPYITEKHILVKAARMDGNFLFIMGNHDMLYLYDPTTGKFRKLGPRVYSCFNYIESMFPISRMVVQN